MIVIDRVSATYRGAAASIVVVVVLSVAGCTSFHSEEGSTARPCSTMLLPENMEGYMRGIRDQDEVMASLLQEVYELEEARSHFLWIHQVVLGSTNVSEELPHFDFGKYYFERRKSVEAIQDLRERLDAQTEKLRNAIH